MKIWNLKFASYTKPDDVFNCIIDGTKTIETRSRNPSDGENDYTNVKEGDILHIVSLDSSRTIDKVVEFNHVYNSVGELIENEDVEKILPGVKSGKKYLEVIEEVKNKWGNKYKFEIENYGMVAIGFK